MEVEQRHRYPWAPVIIGGAQVTSRLGVQEPLVLIDEVLHQMSRCGERPARALRDVDRMYGVEVESWTYEDLGRDIATSWHLNHVRRSTISDFGGHQPVRVLREVVGELLRGECAMALVYSGESNLKNADTSAWSSTPGGRRRYRRESIGTESMWRHGLVLPIRTYPLFENRLTFEEGRSEAEATRESAELCAELSEVASANPLAWFPTRRTVQDIAPVTASNRMICFPYRLSMVAFPYVAMGAAMLVTTYANAKSRGFSDDELVFVGPGAGCDEHRDLLRRPNFGASQALKETLIKTLDAGEMSATEMTYVDIYSCFPIVMKLARRVLGATDSISVTGGLPYFGGPGNSYSLHGLVSMVQRLVGHRDQVGLVYGNGEFMTKADAILLASRPMPLPDAYPTTGQAAALDEQPEVVDDGECVEIETFTVEYGRDGEPKRGFVIGQTQRGQRVAATTKRGDRETLVGLVSGKVRAIGRQAVLTPDPIDGAMVMSFPEGSVDE